MSKAYLHGQIPADDAVLTVLGEVPGTRVVDHDCRKPAGSRGSYEYGLDYGLVLIRRGGYWREANGRGAYLGPTDAFFERPFVEQRIQHHRDSGDRCTSLWLSESAVGALTGDGSVPDEPLMTTPAIDLQHRDLVAGLRQGIDRFEFDERLARLVGALIECAVPGRLTARRSTTQSKHHRVVQHAREAIIADPACVDFGALAQTLGHTRFHISRVFSRVAGTTLSRFRNRVRVAVALERLADGQENLAALSADLGFADQSHFSRVVGASTGECLSALRQRLGGASGRAGAGADVRSDDQWDADGRRQDPGNDLGGHRDVTRANDKQRCHEGDVGAPESVCAHPSRPASVHREVANDRQSGGHHRQRNDPPQPGPVQ
jgi:AraC-like DNA-binding protein